MSKYTVKYEPKSVVQVTMTVLDKDIQDAYAKALNTATLKIQMPGFRKGKAPTTMVESYVGKEKLYEDALNKLIPQEFEKALKEDRKDTKKQVVLLTYPTFNLEKEWKPGDDLNVSGYSTMYPEVDISRIDNELRVKKTVAAEVTEDEINETVNKIFEQYKKIKAEEEKKKQENITEKDNSDTGEVETSIQMDDAFAKAAGAPTLADLRKSIQEELVYDKNIKAEREFEEEVVKQVQDLVAIDIPDILINEELDRIEQRFTSQLSRIGTTLEKYLETENKTVEQVRSDWHMRAEENTKLALILQEIRVQKNIGVEKQEIEMLARQNGINGQVSVDQNNTLAYILGQSKALDMLKKIAAEEGNQNTVTE